MAKILVVDDEKSIRDLIKMTLSIENYEVEEAEDGEMAYRMLEESSYDLVLLDIMLPKMDGYQVLQRIKDRNNFTSKPEVWGTKCGRNKKKEYT